MIRKVIHFWLPKVILRPLKSLVSELREMRKERKIHGKNSLALKKTVDGLVKVELGSGAKKGQGEWLTVDLDMEADVTVDLLKTFPFKDNSIAEIYSSHFLEHFFTNEIIKILSESYRVLIPGGYVSACVPNGEIYISAYSEGRKLDPTIYLRYEPAALIYSSIDYINYIGFLNGHHKHLFDSKNLIELFKSVGFSKVKERGYIENLDMAERDYQSIYVEAYK